MDERRCDLCIHMKWIRSKQTDCCDVQYYKCDMQGGKHYNKVYDEFHVPQNNTNCNWFDDEE